MLMEACVVLLRVSYRMFHKQGISGQHCTVRIIDTATLMEACVVLLRDRDVLKYKHRIIRIIDTATLMEACVVLCTYSQNVLRQRKEKDKNDDTSLSNIYVYNTFTGTISESVEIALI